MDAVASTVGAFPLFAPNPAAVMETDPSDGAKVRQIRIGEALALIWSFVFVASIANGQNSSRPYLYWVGGAIAMVLLYEWALKDTKSVKNGN